MDRHELEQQLEAARASARDSRTSASVLSGLFTAAMSVEIDYISTHSNLPMGALVYEAIGTGLIAGLAVANVLRAVLNSHTVATLEGVLAQDQLQQPSEQSDAPTALL